MQNHFHLARGSSQVAMLHRIGRVTDTPLASIMAVAAMLACNAAAPLVAVAAAFGFTIVINPFLQALTVSGLAALAAILVAIGERQHQLRAASVLAILAAAVVSFTMFVAFNKVVETLGLLALLGASLGARRRC